MISYSSAHSTLRPPGSEVGGFYSSPIVDGDSDEITILSWLSDDGSTGLWGCPLVSGQPITDQAILKASTTMFSGEGCVAVEGIHVQEAGGQFGAWAYI
jgi:hypothetical protein